MISDNNKKSQKCPITKKEKKEIISWEITFKHAKVLCKYNFQSFHKSWKIMKF